jgi:ribA/ribD-fused uncharacterized protein
LKSISIDSFAGEYRFLSNFYPAKCTFEGVEYDTSEHAYQAAKTIDELEREVIREAKSAGAAKRLGKKVTLRDDWNSIKISVMRDVLKSKFSDPVLAQLLIDTGDVEIIESNTWGDTFWGVCNGHGENWLGRCLMGLRASMVLDRAQQ